MAAHLRGFSRAGFDRLSVWLWPNNVESLDASTRYWSN